MRQKMCKGCFKLKFASLGFCLFKNCKILLWQISFDLIYYWIFSSDTRTSLKEGLPFSWNSVMRLFCNHHVIGNHGSSMCVKPMELCTGKIHAHRYVLLVNFASLWLSVFIAVYSCIELFCFIFMSSNSHFFHIFHAWRIF